MPAGGSRTGAGRKPGSRNKRTESKLREVKSSGMTPLEYLLSIMRDESKDEGRRIDAAKAAASYVHAKLSNVEMAVTDETRKPEEVPDTELAHIATSGGKGTAVSAGVQTGLAGVYPGSRH